MSEPTKQTPEQDDLNVWLACFTAALTGSVQVKAGVSGPEGVAELAGKVADAALKEVQKRRRTPEFQTFTVGGS